MKIFFAALTLFWIIGFAGADEPLRILVWNTERGSNPYGPDGRERVLKVVKESQADVVLWQESYQLKGSDQTLGAWVSERLGWKIWQGESPHLAVASRFEQVEKYFHHPWHGVGVRLRDDRDRVFLAWSIWLDYRSPPQWHAQDHPDASDRDLINCDLFGSSRYDQAQSLIGRLDQEGHLEEHIPVLVGGDWNTSSHLDWTPETAKVFPWRRPLALPISNLMRAAGFADCFRVVNPDPVSVPGNTWTPRQNVRENGKPDPPERIDRLYLKNSLGNPGLQPRKTTVFPLDPTDAHGSKTEAIFPSDHAATLLEFDWVETSAKTAGSFQPEPSAASPRLDHRPPRELEPDFSPTRIAWGSCFQESRPCPVLQHLAAEKPQLYLALGDNIYGDTKDMAVLRLKYRRLARHPAWRALTDTARVMATWDDHDYGANDAGENYRPRESSKEIFLDFFDEPAGSKRRSRKGIYTSSILGSGDRTIQIIMLDLRTFRSALATTKSRSYREMGNYRLLRDDEPQVMLGEEQWSWLENEFKKPATIRLIGLSTQLGTAHNGYEAWINLPKERKRFLELVKKTKAEGVILLSGDTHWSEISMVEHPDLYPIYDFTSSSLNQSWDPLGANPNRIGLGYRHSNASIMDIDWDAGLIKTKVIDIEGQTQSTFDLSLDDLKFGVPQTDQDTDFEGKWDSAFGELQFVRSGDQWTMNYPGGEATFKRTEFGLEGTWHEGTRTGKCRFRATSCGRFLQGGYGRGDGPAALAWPAWRPDATGFKFR